MAKTQSTELTRARDPAGELLRRMALRFGVEANKLLDTLKATAFKQAGRNAAPITTEQLIALMVVADQYQLNPFTREIYAFPDKRGGIVPVVSVDGWSRIINGHDQYDGLDFAWSESLIELEAARKCPEWCEARFYRKDRQHPIVVREHLDECYRLPFDKYDGAGKKIGSEPGPWQTHTKRMLRHKTYIQGGRITFGFVGIYDEDEAQRIIEGEAIRVVDTIAGAGDTPQTPVPQTRTETVKEKLREKAAEKAEEQPQPSTPAAQQWGLPENYGEEDGKAQTAAKPPVEPA